MLDKRYLRENLEAVKERLELRGEGLKIDRFKEFDDKRRTLLQEAEALKERRNTVSHEIGALKKKGEDAESLMEEMRGVSTKIKTLDREIGEVEADLSDLLLLIPNLPNEAVPQGADESDNRVLRTWHTPREFTFTPLEHTDIGTALGIIDLERAGRMSGARFSILKGAGARLERALINFMLDLHTDKQGYTEVLPPFMTKGSALTGTGQLPKFADDLFKIEDMDMYLIPTAEVPLTNIHSGEIIDEANLPLYYTAYTPCFRKEAGSYGRDVKGLIRQHQFNKVELVKFTRPETSYEELEGLTRDVEDVLKLLKLPYRAVALCTGDLGFSSAMTIDLEVWLPGQAKYREISSCSNFEAFQARRGGIRCREKGGKPRFLHTINGSGLAVGRTLVAILENYQLEDGSVTVPEVLRPYMGGLEKIVKRG